MTFKFANIFIIDSSSAYCNIFLRCHWMKYCFINGFSLPVSDLGLWKTHMNTYTYTYMHTHTHTYTPGRNSIKKISWKIFTYQYRVYGVFCRVLRESWARELGLGVLCLQILILLQLEKLLSEILHDSLSQSLYFFLSVFLLLPFFRTPTLKFFKAFPSWRSG